MLHPTSLMSSVNGAVMTDCKHACAQNSFPCCDLPAHATGMTSSDMCTLFTDKRLVQCRRAAKFSDQNFVTGFISAIRSLL